MGTRAMSKRRPNITGCIKRKNRQRKSKNAKGFDGVV
jgi:hypothetical protein